MCMCQPDSRQTLVRPLASPSSAHSANIYTNPHIALVSHTTLWSKRVLPPSQLCQPMASSCSSSSLPWLLFLVVVVVLGDAVAAMAMPRPLLGVAQPPAAAPHTAAGPAGATRAGGGGRPEDRSVAGAEVILAGFAAAVMVIVFCYIRVTRKHSSNSSGVGVGLGLRQKQQGL